MRKLVIPSNEGTQNSGETQQRGLRKALGPRFRGDDEMRVKAVIPSKEGTQNSGKTQQRGLRKALGPRFPRG